MTREEATNHLKDILAEATETEHAVCYVTNEDAEALEMTIEALQAQKTGRWIKKAEGLIVTEYECSECGRSVRDDTGYSVVKDYPFCHCGARMECEDNV